MLLASQLSLPLFSLKLPMEIALFALVQVFCPISNLLLSIAGVEVQLVGLSSSSQLLPKRISGLLI